MLARISIPLLAVFLFLEAPLRGQDSPAPTGGPAPISTDRPSYTNSSNVVPVGVLQFENGFLDTSSRGQSTVDGSETLLRLGVASRTELRLSVPNYDYNLNRGSGAGTGFGDLAVGFRQQFGPLRGGVNVSVTAFVSFPTGASTVSSGGYDPGVQVAWSRGVSNKWSVSGMLSLYAPTQGNARNFTGESTLLLDRQLKGPWDVFAEYVGDFPENGGTRQLMDFGTTFKIAARQQLDFRFGVGLTPAAADHFIGVGYSFRFQAFHRE